MKNLENLDLKKRNQTERICLKRFYLPIIALITVIPLFTNQFNLNAQASLAAENKIDDIAVTTKYEKQKVYSVFQDAINTDQWYYMPNELRVAEEVKTNGEIGPKLTILRYQYQDPKDKVNKEGGVLVAAFTYAIEPECVSQIKKAIKQRKGLSNITLSAIPLKSSSIDFLSDSNEFVGNIDAKTATSAGATSASQEMVISFDLTVLGASVFKALASSNGGIPLRANITYTGLTPPCGFKLNGNWENIYKYYEEKELVEGSIGVGPFSFGGSRSKEKIKESLEEIQGLTLEEIGCDSSVEKGNTANINVQKMYEDIHKKVFNRPILTKATELAQLESLLRNTKDPSVKERIIDQMTKGKASLQLGYQKGIKDISKREKGEISINYSKQQHVTRPSSFGGLLNFSKYGLKAEDLVEKGYIIDVDANSDFPSVVIGLPNINPDFDLRSLVLDVSYTNSSGKITSEARQWQEGQGWLTPQGQKVEYVRFNLIGEQDISKRNEPEFDIRLQVVSNILNASFIINKKIKLNNGEKYIDAIEVLTKQIIIDGSDLDFFRNTGNNEDLAIAKFTLTKGNISINKTIKPYSKNGVSGPPDPVYILFPNDDTPESSNVTYILNNNGQKINRTDVLELGENYLGNYEWRGQGN